MTSFNTCAYPGCCERIPYLPGKMKPKKYCPKHDLIMRARYKRAIEGIHEVLGD